MERAYAKDALDVQRALRGKLLDRRGSISYRPAKELAAYLLLYVDDVESAWRVTTEWLCQELVVERVDGGYAYPDDEIYYPGQGEAIRERGSMMSYKGVRLRNADPGMQLVWRSLSPLAIDDISRDARFGASVQRASATIGVGAKLAMCLRRDGQPFALMCADRLAQKRWKTRQFEIFETVGNEVLGPILGTLREFDENSCDAAGARPLSTLTAAEWRVAQIAATGKSYKEIANALNKSFHTIDHQLRGVRRKLGLNSHARLVTFLNDVGVQNLQRPK